MFFQEERTWNPPPDGIFLQGSNDMMKNIHKIELVSVEEID